MKKALLPYRHFGPYHRARIEPTRREFAAAGLELVPVSLFRDSRQYRWSHRMHDAVIQLGLRSDGRDRLAWTDFPALFRAMSRIAPAVVFVNGWSSRDALACHAWCAIHGAARVLISDSQIADRPRGMLKEWLKRRIVAGCKAGFAAGTASTRYLESLGLPAEAITTGCDVVDNAHFAAAAQSRGAPGFRLLTVCRLIPEKNLEAAAQAFLEFVRGRDPSEPWRWTVVGYGPMEARLRAIAENSGARITLAGYRGYDDLITEYAGHDLYFHPSLSEPWGLVVNEAMAAEMPVLVSKQSGCVEDLVTAETGWTFDAASRESMLAALSAAADARSQWRRMGGAAARRIQAFGLDRFAHGALSAAQIALAHDRDRESVHRAGR